MPVEAKEIKGLIRKDSFRLRGSTSSSQVVGFYTLDRESLVHDQLVFIGGYVDGGTYYPDTVELDATYLEWTNVDLMMLAGFYAKQTFTEYNFATPVR